MLNYKFYILAFFIFTFTACQSDYSDLNYQEITDFQLEEKLEESKLNSSYLKQEGVKKIIDSIFINS